MTRPRSTIISTEATPYYHIVSRCVRRAFLCGKDKYTGKDYSYRKDWFMERLYLLQQTFAIDVAAYAIMSNHYHLVLHIDEAKAKSWSDDEVLKRWTQIFYGPHLRKEQISPEELACVAAIAQEWRTRLTDISWFVRCLNEYIARLANKEDNCTGRYWEGRFKSQALLDDKAILSCMAYVDLNPIRAKIAKTPEASRYTSVAERISKAKESKSPNEIEAQPTTLFPFTTSDHLSAPKGIQYRLTDYLELVDYTGRQIKKGKTGDIDLRLPNILLRLGIEPEAWVHTCMHFETKFKAFVGARATLQKVKRFFKTTRIPGMRFSAAVFG